MNSSLAFPFSLCHGKHGVKTEPFTLDAVYRLLVSEDLADQTSAIRKAKAEGNQQAVDELKGQLPAPLFHGRFSQRGKRFLQELSPFLCADFDQLGERKEEVSLILADSLHLVMLFTSPSGLGLKAIFLAPAPAGPTDAAHKARVQHLKAYLTALLPSLAPDDAAFDVARLCYLCRDPEALFRAEGRVPLLTPDLPVKPAKNPLPASAHPLPASGSKGTAHTPDSDPIPCTPICPEATTPFTTPFTPTDRLSLHRKAAELNGIHFLDFSTAEPAWVVQCPAHELHSTRNNPATDCLLYHDGPPTLKCCHNSCHALLEQFNQRLRASEGKLRFLSLSAADKIVTLKKLGKPLPNYLAQLDADIAAADAIKTTEAQQDAIAADLSQASVPTKAMGGSKTVGPIVRPKVPKKSLTSPVTQSVEDNPLPTNPLPPAQTGGTPDSNDGSKLILTDPLPDKTCETSFSASQTSQIQPKSSLCPPETEFSQSAAHKNPTPNAPVPSHTSARDLPETDRKQIKEPLDASTDPASPPPLTDLELTTLLDEGPLTEEEAAQQDPQADLIASTPNWLRVTRQGAYWFKEATGNWAKASVDRVKLNMLTRGYRFKNKDGSLAPYAQAFASIDRHHVVDEVYEVAGYPVGIWPMNNNQILVPKQARPILPTEGDCTDIFNTIGLLLGAGQDPHAPTQFITLLNLMAVAYKRACWWALPGPDGSPPPCIPPLWKPIPALFLVGPVQIGKDFLIQDILKPLLGGRAADPFPFISGETRFNSQLIAAELWTSSDPAPFNREGSQIQRHIASKIKNLITNEALSTEGKNATPAVTCPRSLMTLTVNEGPDNLKALPVHEDDMKDKIITLKCYPGAKPPTNALRDAFKAQLSSLLPHFAHYLLHLPVSDDQLNSRGNVKCFQHPEIAADIEQTSRESQFLANLDHYLFNQNTSPIIGTAAQISQSFINSIDKNPTIPEASKDRLRHSWSNIYHLGNDLAKLSLRNDGRVEFTGRYSHKVKIWTVRPSV